MVESNWLASTTYDIHLLVFIDMLQGVCILDQLLLPLFLVQQLRQIGSCFVILLLEPLTKDILQRGDIGLFNHGEPNINKEGEHEVVEVVGCQRIQVRGDFSDELHGHALHHIVEEHISEFLQHHLQHLRKYDEQPDVIAEELRVGEVHQG